MIPLHGDEPPRGRPGRASQPAGPRVATAAGPEPAGHATADPAEPGDPVEPGDVAAERPEWERRIAGGLAFLRRRITGDYEVDEFGFDRDLTEHVLAAAVPPAVREVVPGGGVRPATTSRTPAARSWSPTTPAPSPLDSVMTSLALLDHHPAHRHLRMLGADLVFRHARSRRRWPARPGTRWPATRTRSGCSRRGELVGVWPEGFKGIGKPFADRYKLQRFGRGGFVAAALRTGMPIIPCSIVGAEEIYPMLGNAKTLARLLGLPYFPITPTFPLLGPLGLVPLPSKWLIEFGEPIETASLGPAAADDPMLVFNLTDQVRETIQQTLYRLLLQRRAVFR